MALMFFSKHIVWTIVILWETNLLLCANVEYRHPLRKQDKEVLVDKIVPIASHGNNQVFKPKSESKGNNFDLDPNLKKNGLESSVGALDLDNLNKNSKKGNTGANNDDDHTDDNSIDIDSNGNNRNSDDVNDLDFVEVEEEPKKNKNDLDPSEVEEEETGGGEVKVEDMLVLVRLINEVRRELQEVKATQWSDRQQLLAVQETDR